MGEIIWVLFLFILKFIAPAILVPVLIWGGIMLYRMSREIKSIRAARGDATAMELEMTRWKARIAGIFAVVLGIGAFAAAAALGADGYLPIFAGAVVFWPLVIWSKVLRARYNASFKKNFVAAELSKVFGNLQYKPNESFSGGEVRGLGFFAHEDGIGGSDFIEADYNGARFSQSDLNVSEIWTETEEDEDGNKREVTRSREVFRGRMMKFDFADAFRGDVQVISGDFGGARLLDSHAGWQSVETELAEFGEHFRVFARDPLDAMAALTPQMIEGIYYVERVVNRPVAFCFRENSMYAFLSTGRDSFEAGKTLLESRDELTRDIKLVTDFLDTMYLKRQEGGAGAPAPQRRRNMPASAPSLAGDLTRKGKRVGSFAAANIGRAVFGIYLLSAVYTFLKLPDGLVLSTNITNPDATSAPTLPYLAVLTVFMLPALNRRMRITWLPYFAALLFFHYMFVSANTGG
jgi:hypothetical protein